MDPKPPKSNSSAIPEDYFNLFQEEDGSIGNIEKDDVIRPLAKRKVTELENENSKIMEDRIYQFEDRNMNKRIKQRVEKRSQGRKIGRIRR
ncbi:hypothetical protein O181_010805 [Austropuccinia psidii MF-1]|uniref:Uncharacterized protein n=1 Tax=Austropuccinia psidii MF-1 TaxID=1389203 RepID=A0A9Q3BUN7_9BASI|nr:hypothetical protein [Austropuccinia psidii MF-1]